MLTPQPYSLLSTPFSFHLAPMCCSPTYLQLRHHRSLYPSHSIPFLLTAILALHTTFHHHVLLVKSRQLRSQPLPLPRSPPLSQSTTTNNHYPKLLHHCPRVCSSRCMVISNTHYIIERSFTNPGNIQELFGPGIHLSAVNGTLLSIDTNQKWWKAAVAQDSQLSLTCQIRC